LVLTAVSSRKTSRVALSQRCCHLQRRRARATSGRSCSAARRLFFFESDCMAIEESPQGGATARNSLPSHRGEGLVQRQIRLLFDQGKQPSRVLLQGRRASTA